MAKQKRDRVHNRHRMVLNQVPGIIAEQCRIYRLWTNGRIKAAEMTSGMSGLREIRQSIEALPPEPMVQPPVHFNIVSVPNGYELGSNGGFTPMPLTIEHDPQPPTRVDERSMEANCELSNGGLDSGQADTPTIETLKAELHALGHDRLIELARVLNVGD